MKSGLDAKPLFLQDRLLIELSEYLYELHPDDRLVKEAHQQMSARQAP